MPEQIPYVVEMRSGAIVEWLMPSGNGSLIWTLDIDKATRFHSEHAAWEVIEWAGCGGKDNVRPVRVKN